MAEEKQKGGVEDIQFTEVKKDKFDPLNSEPIVENLRKNQFTPPPTGKPYEPIPEPQFQAQPTQPMNNFGDSKFSSQPQANGSTSQSGSQPINPDFQEMPNAEKDAAAEQAAEMVLSLYGGLKAAAPKLIIITERRLKKMEKEGLINLSVPLQKSPNDPSRVSILDLVKQFNASVAEGYTVTQEFKDQVRPVLIRVLRKKGIGLTDEQFLIFAFGQDLIQTAFHLIDGYRQRNEVIDQLKSIFEVYKGAPPTFNQQTTPPPPPQPKRNEPEEMKQSRERVYDTAEVVNGQPETVEKPDLIINPKGTKRRGRRERNKPE